MAYSIFLPHFLTLAVLIFSNAPAEASSRCRGGQCAASFNANSHKVVTRNRGGLSRHVPEKVTKSPTKPATGSKLSESQVKGIGEKLKKKCGTCAQHTADPSVPGDKSGGAATSGNPHPGRSNSSVEPRVPDSNSSGTQATTGPAKRPEIAGSVSPNTPVGTGDSTGKGSKTNGRDDSGERATGNVRAIDNDTDTGRKSATARDSDGSVNRKASNDDGSGGRSVKGGDDTAAGKKPAAAPSTTASLGGAPSTVSSMTHNNSRMLVATDGNLLTIAYDKPRSGLADLGIKPGTPLFNGTRNGDKVSGEATTFTRRCGTRTYPVNGTVSAGGSHVVLRGEKPVLGGNCAVTGTTSEVLEFDTGS